MDHAPPPPPPDPGSCLEVRLFYVRVAPHGGAAPPPRLALELRPAAGGEEAIPLALRLDRHDAAAGEVTYVSTASARLAPPAAAFEVADHRGAVLLRGSLRRCPPGAKAADSPAWEIDCVPAAAPRCSSLLLGAKNGLCSLRPLPLLARRVDGRRARRGRAGG